MRDQRMPTQLPNGDMYLGPHPEGRPDNISAPGTQDPTPVNAAEAALDKVISDATHQPEQARIECPWCGQISEGREAFKTHIKLLHSKEMAASAEDKRSEDEQAEEFAMEQRAKRAREGEKQEA